MIGMVLALYRYIFARKIFFRFNKLIYQMSLHGMGILNYKDDIQSGEDFFMRGLDLAKNGVIMDVGANIGEYGASLRSRHRNIRIICFEPHPFTFLKLEKNLRGLNIEAHNLGVGASEGSFTLYDYADNDGSEHASLHRGVIEQIHKGSAVEHQVKVVSLDDFAVHERVERIALLKIDTEGHEFEVLRGATRLLKNGKIDIIHFEFNEMNVVSGVFFKNIWDFLPQYNFYRMLPDGLVQIKNYNPVFCEIFAYQNIVAKLKAENE
jgi:FkbM family methyltransferase